MDGKLGHMGNKFSSIILSSKKFVEIVWILVFYIFDCKNARIFLFELLHESRPSNIISMSQNHGTNSKPLWQNSYRSEHFTSLSSLALKHWVNRTEVSVFETLTITWHFYSSPYRDHISPINPASIPSPHKENHNFII